MDIIQNPQTTPIRTMEGSNLQVSHKEYEVEIIMEKKTNKDVQIEYLVKW